MAAVAEIRRRERAAAVTLLRAEAGTLKRLRGAVRHASDSLVAAVAPMPNAAAATLATTRIRHGMTVLQGTAHAALTASAAHAREVGRAPVARDLGVIEHGPDADGAIADDAAAASAATSLASAWAMAGLGLVNAWPASDESRPLSRDLAGLHKAMDGRVRRTAATETARAFNDARTDVIERAGVRLAANDDAEQADEAQLPADGLYKIWSAVIDGRTCAVCRSHDGESVPPDKSFDEGVEPPLHPICRCIVDYLIVREKWRIQDVARFRSEVRDIMRQRRDEERAEAVEAARQASAPAPAPVKAAAIVRPPPPPPKPVPHGSALAKAAKDLGANIQFPDDAAKAAEEIFGKGKTPDAAAWRAMWQVPAGFDVQFSNFTTDGAELSVRALIMRVEKQVGEIENTFLRKGGKLVSKLDYISVDAEHHGKGFAQTFMGSSIDAYRKMGVDRIELDAGLSAGKYTWARFGFTWSDAEAKSRYGEFRAFLAAKVPKLSAEELDILAQTAHVGAHAVASVEIAGEKLGKEYLLGGDNWFGSLKLHDGDLGFEVAKRRLAGAAEVPQYRIELERAREATAKAAAREEAARIKAEQETKLRREAERKAHEAETRRKAAEEAQAAHKAAAAEAKRVAEEQAAQAAKREAKAKAEEAARTKAEAERKVQAAEARRAEEAKRHAETEAKRIAAEEAAAQKAAKEAEMRKAAAEKEAARKAAADKADKAAKAKAEQPAPKPPAARAPRELEVGVHVKTMRDTADLTPHQISAITSPITADPGVMAYLEKHPLEHLRFADQLYGGALGNYDPGDGHMVVSTVAIHGETFGLEWKPGRAEAISKTMPDAESSVRATFTHELGHHIHTHDIGSDLFYKVDDVIQSAYSSALVSSYITQYSRTNAEEFFAENWAAYHLRKDDLLKHDPAGFAMVEQVMKLRGIR